MKLILILTLVLTNLFSKFSLAKEEYKYCVTNDGLKITKDKYTLINPEKLVYKKEKQTRLTPVPHLFSKDKKNSNDSTPVVLTYEMFCSKKQKEDDNGVWFRTFWDLSKKKPINFFNFSDGSAPSTFYSMDINKDGKPDIISEVSYEDWYSTSVYISSKDGYQNVLNWKDQPTILFQNKGNLYISKNESFNEDQFNSVIAYVEPVGSYNYCVDLLDVIGKNGKALKKKLGLKIGNMLDIDLLNLNPKIVKFEGESFVNAKSDFKEVFKLKKELLMEYKKLVKNARELETEKKFFEFSVTFDHKLTTSYKQTKASCLKLVDMLLQEN